jgi:plastocyanin
MTFASRLTFAILLGGLTVTTIGCSGSGSSNTPGTGGSGGGAGNGGTGAGTAGSGGGGGSGGSGGSGAPFMAFAPCSAESNYVTTPTTIAFGGTVGFDYAPKCLKVPAGTSVTFSGDFATHPLAPSAMRGNTTNNPIVNMSNGTTASFSFPTPGFYAYLCNFHGSDDGAFMSGVIWVQ